MIRSSSLRKRTRRIDSRSMKERVKAGQMSLGLVVIVLEPGIYNNEMHRANPKAEIGDVITVASGGYGETLIENGKVSLFEADSFSDAEFEDEEVVSEVAPKIETTDEIAAEAESRRAGKWQDLKAAGITDTAAKALYAAGVQSKENVIIITRMGDEGRRQLTNLKGVGEKTVDSLFEWALEDDG